MNVYINWLFIIAFILTIGFLCYNDYVVHKNPFSFTDTFLVTVFLAVCFFFAYGTLFIINSVHVEMTNETYVTSTYDTDDAYFLEEVPNSKGKYLEYVEEDESENKYYYRYYTKNIVNNILVPNEVNIKNSIIIPTNLDTPKVIKAVNENNWEQYNNTNIFIPLKYTTGSFSSSEITIFLIPEGSVINIDS